MTARTTLSLYFCFFCRLFSEPIFINLERFFVLFYSGSKSAFVYVFVLCSLSILFICQVILYGLFLSLLSVSLCLCICLSSCICVYMLFSLFISIYLFLSIYLSLLLLSLPLSVPPSLTAFVYLGTQRMGRQVA